MTNLHRVGLKFLAAVLLTATLGIVTVTAQSPLLAAEARGIRGRAQFSTGGGPFQPLKSGTALRPGDVVQTATDSAVDIYLGPAAGTVRLTETATMSIDKMLVSDTNSEVELNLKAGELLGNVSPSAGTSKFVVKAAAGMGAMVKGQFRFDSRGYVVLVDGKAIFVTTPETGDPVAHTLSAPPAVYFSPGTGVQPAPAQLVKEVQKQAKARLPKG